jgi:hypothetical protein
VLALCELVFTDGPVGHFGIHPHPQWLIILGMAGAHGMVAGLCSVVVGIGVQLLGLGAIHGLGEAWATIVSNPEPSLLALAGAFLVGEIHDAHARTFRNMRARWESSRDHAERLVYERDVLFASIQRLKKRIEDQPVHLANLLQSSSRMQGDQAGSLSEKALALVVDSCNPSKASVWNVADDGRISLVAVHGWSEEERAERTVSYRTSDLVQFAVRMRCEVKAFDFPGSARAEDPILIAPLKDVSGKVSALLCLDEVPAPLLSPESVAVFFGCAEWASASLSAQPDEEAQDAVPLRRVLDSLDLGERLRVEFDRSARYGSALGVGLIQAPMWRHGSEAAQRELDGLVARVFAEQLQGRELYRFGHPGCYAVVLPGVTGDTDEEGALPAPVVAEGGLRFETKIIAADTASPDLRSLLVRMDGHLRRRSRNKLPQGVPIAIPPAGHVGTLDGLLRRLRTELSVSHEMGDETQLAILALPTGVAAPPAGTEQRAWVEGLRPSDALFQLDERRIVALLPNTDRAGADKAMARFTQHLIQMLGLDEAAFGMPRFVVCKPEGFAPLDLLEQVEAEE